MKVNAERIYVFSPGDVVTGGPEALHQLVDELRLNGHDAYISYYPRHKDFQCPSPYRQYDAPQAKPHDADDSLMVIPEAATYLVDHFKYAQTAIWWLSVDNYLLAFHKSWIKDKLRPLKYYLLGRWKRISSLKGCYHFNHGAYVRDFLHRAGIEPLPLSDCLSQAHLNVRRSDMSRREDWIAYNPTKGERYTKRLIAGNGDLKFVPIKDMSPDEVAELLSRAKVYIDFGHHPGKDRLPREAAMAGCCVITGIQGSAAFHEDVPIDERYKIDERRSGFETKFRELVVEIFDNFETNYRSFDSYRDYIMKEPKKFREEVLEIFGQKSSGV